MRNIQIIGRGKYIPQKEINNKLLSKQFGIDEEKILELSGIEKRFYTQDEKMEDMAYMASLKAIEDGKIKKENIDMIIVATTSTTKIMPGISFLVQKKLDIKKCMCLDVLGGCSGYINAFDIAEMAISLNKINTALIIGVERLSKIIDEKDYSTAILMGDGAGATIISNTDENKIYASSIRSQGQESDLLVYEYENKLSMQGKKIYKYAITKVAQNINKLLEDNKLDITEIKYIIPHQSNLRILTSMAEKIGSKPEQIYINISNIGNTFNASIPIVIDEMMKKDLLKDKDKIILVGYGGGLNLGSILIEI